MKILICGNINSGKSFLIEKLRMILPDYNVVKIDECRKQFGDGTCQGESVACEAFVSQIIDNENVIIECTGLGKVVDKLISQIPDADIICLHLDTPIKDCISRISCKDFSITPYIKVSESMADTITRIDGELKSGELQKKWSGKVSRIIKISDIAELYNIPFRQYEYLVKVTDILKIHEQISTLVLYGSAGRDELTIHSDIDMYVVTQSTAKQVLDHILNELEVDYYDILKNKIVLRTKGIMIEIVVVSSIEDNLIYYANSMITSASSALLKGSIQDIEILDNATKDFATDYAIDESEIVSSMMYYLLSLKDIAKAGDEYKFYFHNSLCMHAMNKLKNIIDGNNLRNYLPVMSHKLIGIDFYMQCCYNYENDKSQVICNLVSHALAVLNKLEAQKYKMQINILHTDYVRL